MADFERDYSENPPRVLLEIGSFATSFGIAATNFDGGAIRIRLPPVTVVTVGREDFYRQPRTSLRSQTNMKQQDDGVLDHSTSVPAASVSSTDGQLPIHPSDATASTSSVVQNGGDVDARMAEIEVILDHSAIRLLDKCALVAEWVGHAEAKASVFGQLVHKPQGGRPEGGIARAARELAIPGKSIGGRRKFIERA
jgi:hypothetical protein